MTTTTDTCPDIPLGATFDAAGRILTYKKIGGYWCKYTYDNGGNMTTFKSRTGFSWKAIATADTYTLGYEAKTKLYNASCREFTRDEALAHWGNPREDNKERAAIFLEAIKNNKE